MKKTEKKNEKEQLEKAIAEDKKKREATANKGITAILEEHNCTLSVSMLVAPEGNSPIVKVIAK